jgi:hypothetical protein
MTDLIQQAKDQSAAIDKLIAENKRLEKLLAARTRQVEDRQRYWLAAAEKALAGDMRDLDIKVGLTKETGKVVQS